MQHPNTTLDDVCALIGFSATVQLVEWYGGTTLYVPATATADHPLAKLLGTPHLKALAGEFGRQTLWVPCTVLHKYHRATKLKKQVAKLVLKGLSPTAVGQSLAISERQVQRIRNQLAGAGLLDGLGTLNLATD